MSFIFLVMFARNVILSDKYLLSWAQYYRNAHRNSCRSQNLCTEQNEQKLAYFPTKIQQMHLGPEIFTAVDAKSRISCGYNFLHATCLMMVSCMSSSNALNMGATYSPKLCRVSVDYTALYPRTQDSS
jgi:hypothetical protein